MTTSGWRIPLCGRVAEMDADRVFRGSVPALYDQHLGPLIFVPYADDLASRLADMQHGRILETAAGTGMVTRALVSSLPESVSMVATDLTTSECCPSMAGRCAPHVLTEPFSAEAYNLIVVV
jgi:hypothetical protein